MQCSGIKANGEPCQAAAIRGSEYCFMHQSDQTIANQARLLGGINRKVGGPVSTFPGKIKSLSDLETLLNTLLEDVWTTWENSERRAKTLLTIADLFARLLPVSDQENRLVTLEALIYGNKIPVQTTTN